QAECTRRKCGGAAVELKQRSAAARPALRDRLRVKRPEPQACLRRRFPALDGAPRERRRRRRAGEPGCFAAATECRSARKVFSPRRGVPRVLTPTSLTSL